MFPTIRATFTESGALSALLADNLSLLQYPASDLEAGPQQVWLRIRGEQTLAAPLTGPASGACVRLGDSGAALAGAHEDVRWSLLWQQPGPGLFGWTLRVVNDSTEPVTVDAVYLLDAALTPPSVLRRNEYYVSQYLDVAPIGAGGDSMLAVRQNMPGTGNPWMALTVLEGFAAWCTDGLQIRADQPGSGLDLTRDLPSTRLQHEHTLVGLQTLAVRLEAGESHRWTFAGVVSMQHPEASSDDDVERVCARLQAAHWAMPDDATGTGVKAVPTLFAPAHMLHGEDLSVEEFLRLVGEPDAVERGADGTPWAYWAGEAHVVAAAKERMVLRPHGQILQTSSGFGPQDVTTASTVWMAGTFASQVTRGHADADPVVSVRRSYLGLTLAEGLRVLVRLGEWHLLGAPSAWSVTPTSATWWYCFGERTVIVCTELTLDRLHVQISVEGGPLEMMVVTRGVGGDDGVLFRDGRSRGLCEVSLHPLATQVRLDVELARTGADAVALETPSIESDDPSVRRLARIIPWFAANARIHYQTPRGLEQFTGGAWGTRDVCQGPVGLLLATDQLAELRAVLLTVFRGQQANGDWPQWFDYLEGHVAPGYRDSHGDVVYWPLLALAEYLEASGDFGILDEAVSWVGPARIEAASPLRSHVEAAVQRLGAARSLDWRLPAYGHGDWNDSLQPANPLLARSMTSTWTAGLEVKTLRALGRVLEGHEETFGSQLLRMADDTEHAILEQLLIDDELCGYALVSEEGVEPLVHPRDTRTGLHHGSLQMIHAIADELLTPDQARQHVDIIDAALDGPTGIYLFDKPVSYHGGETHTFLRAEAASFWGREIGLMYMHAHVRWVEALLRLGDAERAWDALQRVLPEGQRHLVPGLAPMQSNCYYSSIDATFSDRYEAQENASELFDAERGFAGGWRIYSSGPGLVLRLVTEHLLGLKWTAEGLEIDPMLPVKANGLTACLKLGGKRARVAYRVAGAGLSAVRLDGREVSGDPIPRRYRSGGIRIPKELWEASGGQLDIWLG